MNLLAEGYTVSGKCSVLEKDKNSVGSIVYLRESLNGPQYSFVIIMIIIIIIIIAMDLSL